MALAVRTTLSRIPSPRIIVQSNGFSTRIDVTLCAKWSSRYGLQVCTCRVLSQMANNHYLYTRVCGLRVED